MTWFWTEAIKYYSYWVLSFTLTPAFLHKVANLMGLQLLMKAIFKRNIYIFHLYLHESCAVASVGCICDGAKWETLYPQFSHLIIREGADHPVSHALVSWHF